MTRTLLEPNRPWIRGSEERLRCARMIRDARRSLRSGKLRERYEIERQEDSLTFYTKQAKALNNEQAEFDYVLRRIIVRKLTPTTDPEPFSMKRFRAALASELRAVRVPYAGRDWRWRYPDERREEAFAKARKVRAWIREQLKRG